MLEKHYPFSTKCRWAWISHLCWRSCTLTQSHAYETSLGSQLGAYETSLGSLPEWEAVPLLFHMKMTKCPYSITCWRNSFVTQSCKWDTTKSIRCISTCIVKHMPAYFLNISACTLITKDEVHYYSRELISFS